MQHLMSTCTPPSDGEVEILGVGLIAGTATLTVLHELDESPHVTAFLLYPPPGHCVGVFILRIVARQI